ncbi:MAG: hypothetical protein JWQ24_3546, partial [Tardiphaga sp.]|nr:hypothetical protein [Tardiphaga sp.]
MRGHLSLRSDRAPAPVAAPSPLVGEGYAEMHPELARERGCQTHGFRLWLPLSRPRFARPPS